MNTQNETKHTPTPWAAEKCRSHSGKTFFTINGQGPMGLWIADINNDKLINGEPVDLNETDEANAAFIVRACNAHDELVAALEGLLSDKYLSDPINNDRMAPARAALAKVRGEQ